MIIDCHVHLANKQINRAYCKVKDANKYISIRYPDTIMIEEEYYQYANQDENMYIIEHIDRNLDLKKELHRIKENLKKSKRIVGIKLYPGYQHFYPNEKELYEVYEFAQKNDLVVVFHSGDVNDDAKQAKEKYIHPQYIDDIAVDFPNVKFVISHLAFPYMLETAMIVNKNDNVYTDISGLVVDDDGDEIVQEYIKDIKRILVYYPKIKEKMMYGTDYGGEGSALTKISPYKELVENIFKDQETKEKVYWKTVSKLYQI